VPQPRINVDIDLGLPDLPGMPSLPNVPTPTRPGGLPAPGTAARGAPRPGGGAQANDGSRATSGTGAVAKLPLRPDPVGELRFTVKLPNNTELGRFRECTGLAAEIECKDYNEGGVNDFVHKLPTRMKYPNLVLKRGVTYEDALLKWLWSVQRELVRGPVTIQLKGPDLNTSGIRTWVFSNAFPIKWTGPNLNAGSNQVATETLEIVHTGLNLSP
jgi:phage tail-like protein